MPEKSLHQILGVSPDASQAEIRAAYLKQAKQWHPDLNRGNEVEAEGCFKIISSAYEVLSDKNRNASYNQSYHGSKSQENDTNLNNTVKSSDIFKQYLELLLHLSCTLAHSGFSEKEIFATLIKSGTSEEIAREVSKRAFELKGSKRPKGASANRKNSNKVKSKNGVHSKTKSDQGRRSVKRETEPRYAAKQKTEDSPNPEAEPNDGGAENLYQSTHAVNDVPAIMKKMFKTLIFEIFFGFIAVQTKVLCLSVEK